MVGGLVPADKNAPAEPMLITVHDTIWRHYVTMNYRLWHIRAQWRPSLRAADHDKASCVVSLINFTAFVRHWIHLILSYLTGSATVCLHAGSASPEWTDEPCIRQCRQAEPRHAWDDPAHARSYGRRTEVKTTWSVIWKEINEILPLILPFSQVWLIRSGYINKWVINARDTGCWTGEARSHDLAVGSPTLSHWTKGGPCQ